MTNRDQIIEECARVATEAAREAWLTGSLRDALNAALAIAPQPPTPADMPGWQWVPKEPTEEIITAITKARLGIEAGAVLDSPGCRKVSHKMYVAALASAPIPQGTIKS